MRPDYCPIGNEPCQSLCDEPCSTTPKRKPLTDKQIDDFRVKNSEGRGAGWRFNFKGFARAIEQAHGIGEKT